MQRESESISKDNLSSNESTRSVTKAVSDLEDWISSSNWIGYDPYDIKGEQFYLQLAKGKSFPKRAVCKILFELIETAPLLTRKLFKVKPTVNAKAMGLFTAAYARLYLIDNKTDYLGKALQCADWLLQHPSKGYSGLCWGYPFDWQSVIFIPKGTPSGVVTSIVGEGLWLLYEITNDKRYLDACKDICLFFTKGLNITYEDQDRLCFSYTPLDDYMVHNANLFVAEFLAGIGSKTNNPNWIDIAIKCGNFAVADQNPDGTLCYWAKSQQASHSGGVCRMDHYHAGFEIRKLYGLWKITGDENFRKAYLSYLVFYKNNFIGENAFPKMTPRDYFPVNIHSCAEAILLTSTLSEDHAECRNLAKDFFQWTIKNMQIRPGQYRYMIRKMFGQSKSDMPYIRWNQAWMFRALSELKYCLCSCSRGA